MTTFVNIIKDLVYFGSLAALPGIAVYYLSKVATTRKAVSRQPVVIEEVILERVD